MTEGNSASRWTHNLERDHLAVNDVDGSVLCQHARPRADWRELGRRVLSEASRIAKEEADLEASGGSPRRDAFVADQTTDGQTGSCSRRDTHTTTPVAWHRNTRERP